MARVLMIGAGGVATVAAFKIAQNADVFTEFMIASRRKQKCDKIVEDIHKAGYKLDTKSSADGVSPSMLSRAKTIGCCSISGSTFSTRR